MGRGTLPQLESGRGNPRMDTFLALVRVLKVALNGFLYTPAMDQAVVRAGDGPRVGTPALWVRHLRDFSLTTEMLKFSELSIIEEYGIVSDPHQPGIFEHVLIASGVVRTDPVGEEVEEVLEPKDCRKFRGDRKHRSEVIEGPVLDTLLMEYPSQVGIHGVFVASAVLPPNSPSSELEPGSDS